MSERNYNIMIVAGEASGDLHAAKLVDAIRNAAPDSEIKFFGAAGEKMRAAGVEAVVRADDLSIVGLLEIGRALPMFLRTYSTLKRVAAERYPDVAILVDFPDFNLKLAKALSKQGIPVAYYISPQLWAWRGYRIRTIIEHVDLLISILPFEKDWYAERGVDHVEYVGSPLAREVHATEGRNEFAARHELDPERPIIALLPGSRNKEIVRILPVMLDAVDGMSRERPDLQFVVAVGSEKNARDVARTLGDVNHRRLPVPAIITNETFNVLAASDVAAVTSGTATLETGIIGTPMAIVYKTSALNYKLLRPLIDVEHFGLINLIAGERVANEFIQDEFTPKILARELFRLLDPVENQSVRGRLKAAADKLGHGGASHRAAEHILRLINDG
jgi:lipid-A-disaccharide synthase